MRSWLFDLLVVFRAVTEAQSRLEALSSLTSEADAVKFLTSGGEGDATEAAKVDAEDVESLVHRGWHDAVRAVVAQSHKGSEEDAQRVATQVRQAVQAEKNRLDDLIRVLDRNYGKAVDVSPAMQWAQNSTHVFISVKFAQRWNAPGALEVQNATMDFSTCCMNFTAFGEHSMIRRRYHLAMEMFAPLKPQGCTWFFAAAGRMTITLEKAAPSNWVQLLRNMESLPKNVGVWRDMREKWRRELSKLVPETPQKKATKGADSASKKPDKQTKKQKRKSNVDDDEADEASDAEVDLIDECQKSWFESTKVAELCADTWEKVVADPRVAGRRWLVQVYTSAPEALNAPEKEKTMRGLKKVWSRLADLLPSSSAGGRVGALDCHLDAAFCKRLGFPGPDGLPQVRRFAPRDGSGGALWEGSIDASFEDFVAFAEAGRQEL